jgi:transaldolase
MNRLQELHDAGVSIWLDTLSRELLESGEFATLVDAYAVTGATSNPTIFAKAITSSDRYDDQLRSLVSAGISDTRELFFAVALDDVRAAAKGVDLNTITRELEHEGMKAFCASYQELLSYIESKLGSLVATS